VVRGDLRRTQPLTPRCFVVGLVLYLCVLHAAVAQAADPPALHIPRVSQPPALEDFLEQPPTDEAVVTAFVQRAPRDGDAVSQSTTAYLSYDDDNLYVVFVCKDERGKTRARLTPRDDIAADDLVGVYLDTFHDRQRAYFFKINPLGVQADEIVTEGQDADASWDTVWHTRGRLVQDGYVVWAAIPFASLRFSNQDVQVWGIALTRYIQRNNEDSYWPYITDRLEGLAPQFATLEGITGISSTRNTEFVPHVVYTGARLLEPAVNGGSAFRTDNEPNAGVDLKVVLHDSFTLDVTANPEFSQVESNDPQVTINQRFEVFFPEKRPFFLENAGFFQTPEQLFFSRRIADPQAGVRLTGKAGRWAVGALAIDDRAPGENRAPDDPLRDRRALTGAIRVAREFANRSTIGFLTTSRDFASRSNRVVAADTRLTLGAAWAMTAQITGSRTQGVDGTRRSGFAATAEADRTGLHFGYTGKYVDRSPGFESDLGFIPRVDIRETTHTLFYLWRPANTHVVSFGPQLTASGNWDRRRRVQDWSGVPGFQLEFPGPTKVSVAVTRSFELFEELPFRKLARTVTFSTDRWKWLGIALTSSRGRGVNYYPGEALQPLAAAFPADFADTSVTTTLKPGTRLRLDEIYFYNRLTALDGRTIFNSHTARTRANYQFTRALSLRAIVDYNGVLPDEDLVALERAKRVTYDLLFAYLLKPGTAVYVGYTDTYENLALEQPSNELRRIVSPTTSTGRQLFVKASYLFRLTNR
jgi:hypothetical protein